MTNAERRTPNAELFAHTIPAGDGFTRVLPAGCRFRITDLEGNQAVDTLFFAHPDGAERYDATATLQAQRRVYLTTGSRLVSNRGRTLLTITDDTCGRHDTLGGACACESNQVRYDLGKRHMHACRETFLLQLARHATHLSKRDCAHNINFFMNVPVTPEGGLTFADGISAAGRHVELRAEVDCLVVISNCPQLNNPCNGWNPTPVRVEAWA
jgi:urea carboxylase-associated protein 1